MTPGSLIRWYFRERDSFGAPSMNFVDSTGRMYASKCDCGHTIRHSRSDGSWVCGHCGKPWEFEDRHIFKGEVQTSVRVDSFEYRHAKWIDVGTQLYQFIRDPERGVCAKVFVAYTMGFKITEISAANSNALWGTESGAPWSERTVYRHKEVGRSEWTRRLLDAGIPFDQD